MTEIEKTDDGKLYNSFLTGDISAYDQLMIRHGDSLTLYLYGYLHDWQDAEDLMIEAFARIMAKKPKIRDGGFKAYLFKTGRNLAARFHLKRSRFLEQPIDDYAWETVGRDLVESVIEDEERRRILYLCLDRINPSMKEALWLVYIEGMSYAEASHIMKVNMKKIDHLLERGKKQMRKELEKEGIRDAYK